MIKIAIVGIGNCASSLIQGISHYKKESNIDGLLNWKIGQYVPSDIEIVAAFDIDKRKVGKPVNEAIFSLPNNTKIFCKDLKESNTIVQRGPTLDGFSELMKSYPEEQRFVESDEPSIDVVKILKDSEAEILINYLPVGSEAAAKYYADCCLEAGVHFINAIPVFISSTQNYIDKFESKNLLCAGDDIKAQLGATIVHRVLTNLFEKRGVKLLRTYQLNTGGNTDFLNMLERSRLDSKKISKTDAVQSQLKSKLDNFQIHIGPSDYVPWQKDNKICYIRMEAELFGGIPMELDVKLSVEDSPNSAGVMIDAIRVTKLASDNGLKGYLKELSAFSFKHPLEQMTDDEAIKSLKEFIKNNET